MDLEQIGYFIFMDEQERKYREQQEHLKVNAETEQHLVGEKPTTNREWERK